MKALNINNSVAVNGIRRSTRRLSKEAEDYLRGVAHGSTGEHSAIEQDQSNAYYDGVAKGMRDYKIINPPWPGVDCYND